MYTQRIGRRDSHCEVLDLFNRQDNIWISKANGKVSLRNMYDNYDLRPALLKSKQFYRDYFGSDVETLVEVIEKYKQLHGAHKKDEAYLPDLLK